MKPLWSPADSILIARTDTLETVQRVSSGLPHLSAR
jgi:hypothetical protein